MGAGRGAGSPRLSESSRWLQGRPVERPWRRAHVGTAQPHQVACFLQGLHAHFTSIHRTPETWALTRPCLRLLWFL